MRSSVLVWSCGRASRPVASRQVKSRECKGMRSHTVRSFVRSHGRRASSCVDRVSRLAPRTERHAPAHATRQSCPTDLSWGIWGMYDIYLSMVFQRLYYVYVLLISSS